MKLEYQYDKGRPKVKIQILNKDATLNEILPVLEEFLLACGYRFNGQLEVVEEDVIEDKEI